MKYTEKDYINKCIEFNVEYIGNHKEKKLGTVIDFICPRHRNKGIQSVDWSHFHTYKYGCKFCSGRGKNNNDILPLIKNKDVELVSDYIGNEKPIDCKCKKCGNLWTTLPKILITNGSGCPICGRLRANYNETKNHFDFIAELSLVNPDIEIIGQYNGTHKKIKCRCKIDGTIWLGYPANLLNGSAGCPTCNISNGEREMLKILKSLGINYSQQHTIDGCSFKRNLRFDAYDTINNIAFEYNGEQHYRPVDFANKGEEWAKKQFELTKERDMAKLNFCKKNKIPVIIIPYWEKDHMESFIVSELNKLGKDLTN